MSDVLRSRPASDRRSDGPPGLKHRRHGGRWAEPLRLGSELESPRRCGVERPLEQLLRNHGGDGDLITGLVSLAAVFNRAGVGARMTSWGPSCALPYCATECGIR